MRIFLLADLHGDNSLFDSICNRVGEKDLLLLAGDITHFGDETRMAEMFAGKEALFSRIAAIHGNCDLPGAAEWLSKTPYGFHEKVEPLGKLRVFGLGGSLPCPGSTPMEITEGGFAEKFKALKKAENQSHPPLAFLLHQPPYNTALDSLYSGERVGSRSVRDAIEEYQPLFCVSGHIHESRAIDNLGETWLINPGPAMDGNYAVFDLDTGEVSLERD